VFRVLPRKDAAAVFEYLPHEAKEALLKAMAKDDVATLLNDMAPGRPHAVPRGAAGGGHRELLALLTPAERAVALTLLGYPERSVGRLMTPHYVAVRENWTSAKCWTTFGLTARTSETLDVIYVIDEQDC
jgi:magnesium transporter